MQATRGSPTMVLALLLAATTAALGALAFAGSRARPCDPAGPPPLLPDLNAAPERHLLLLPGVGPARARAIVEARRAGPFASAGDLERVRGIGPGTVSALAALVRVARPRETPTGADP